MTATRGLRRPRLAGLAGLAAVVGPGLLAGLSDDDPAGITTYSVLGNPGHSDRGGSAADEPNDPRQPGSPSRRRIRTQTHAELAGGRFAVVHRMVLVAGGHSVFAWSMGALTWGGHGEKGGP